ncbi:MAG: radical SAM protein [Elusimicrobiales bacterium]
MKQPDHLVIYLSGRCDLACPYCYAKGVDRRIVTAAALEKALEDFAAAKPEAPKFTVLGGEPLFCRDRLYQSLAGVRRLFGPAPVHVFTNGLRLKKGEASALIRRGVKLTVSLDGRPGGARRRAPAIPPALREKVSASAVVSPANAGELASNMLYLLEQGYTRLAWSPDITAAWDKSALAKLKTSARALLLEYLRRLKSGRGVWELANGYEAVALAARGERPGPCRNIALAPDGFFYPCDKMLSAPAKELVKFRIKAGGEGREKFFSLARGSGLKAAQSMCPVAPWAAARFGPKKRAVPAGQAAARGVAARWLAAAAKAGLASPAFRRIHGI